MVYSVDQGRDEVKRVHLANVARIERAIEAAVTSSDWEAKRRGEQRLAAENKALTELADQISNKRAKITPMVRCLTENPTGWGVDRPRTRTVET